MSPRQFHAKQEQHDGGSFDHSSLKIINKNSTFIPRLPPSPSTGSSTTATSDALTNKPHAQQPPPRRPVIIYTHSPKVIHTHPRDFMALVQKLTGYTPPQEGTQRTQERGQQCGQGNAEDNESANSVVSEEHGTSVNDVPQVNSCFVDNGVGVGVGVTPYRANTGFDNPYFNPTPVFSTNPNDFMCAPSHQLPFYNADTMFMNRNAVTPSSSLRVLKDYP